MFLFKTVLENHSKKNITFIYHYIHFSETKLINLQFIINFTQIPTELLFNSQETWELLL